MRQCVLTAFLFILLSSTFLGVTVAELNAQQPLGEALPESKCGPLDKLGRCTGSPGGTGGGASTSSSTINMMQMCRSSCNSVYGQCLMVMTDDKLKEDCNRKQVFCMKACDPK
jgi:hypothetical protein